MATGSGLLTRTGQYRGGGQACGHPCESGPDEVNYALSKRPAAAVVTYLTAHGILTGQLRAGACEATRPVASNDTPPGAPPTAASSSRSRRPLMLDGFGYEFSQMALLFLVSVVLGIVLGRYAWPRRPYRQRAHSAAAVPLPNGTSRTGTGPAASLVADTQARAAYTEVKPEQAQARVAELEARLNESQSTLKETWLQLRQTDAEMVRMRLRAQDLEDRKEAEMGRLESRAIAALETTMATHREQVAKLEEKLRAVESTAEQHVRELAVERSRSAQLQSALTDRDQHIATLMSERAQQERASGVGR